MEKDNKNHIRTEFYELSAHHTSQFVLFILISAVCTIFAFWTLLNLSEYIIKGFLYGEVTHDGTERTMLITDEPDHSYIHEHELWEKDMADIKSDKKAITIIKTEYYTNWSVDLNIGTPSEVRFWINPTFSFFVPSIIIGIILAALTTSILPLSIGFMRRRIEREIVYNLDKICYIVHHYYSKDKNAEIEQMILNADIHDLHIFEKDWGIPIDEIKIIHAALKWRNSSSIYRALHIVKGINIYLRLYFTEKYANAILGFVYIGAAILIIIIGLRGLKFIPATQPSPIIFSLAVEFSLLLTYAFTLIFAKPEQVDSFYDNEEEIKSNSIISPQDNSRDIENILRAFIKKEK